MKMQKQSSLENLYKKYKNPKSNKKNIWIDIFHCYRYNI